MKIRITETKKVTRSTVVDLFDYNINVTETEFESVMRLNSILEEIKTNPDKYFEENSFDKKESEYDSELSITYAEYE